MASSTANSTLERLLKFWTDIEIAAQDSDLRQRIATIVCAVILIFIVDTTTHHLWIQFQQVSQSMTSADLERREIQVRHREELIDLQEKLADIDIQIALHERLAHTHLKCALHHEGRVIDLKKMRKAIEADKDTDITLSEEINVVDILSPGGR
ncbi:hypothetical protein GYMLUDRAFT_74760 [Collybiopsis luxurians FD-317 M1]|uniref:Uncharacterized protein n=1 Tax=Collybiopsis luxurians FD-317 M1 TaxID=944289 RepID=A0A0D0CSL6_9AGAR|nr:hypothetical protein GYMLUDRAFT_74760 [Collybiopsis luxurians FD-317 M1]